MTAVEGNASVYQVYTIGGITGEGRAKFLRAWGPGFEREGAAGGGRAAQPVRGNYKSLKGTNPTVVGGMHQFVMYIL